MYVLLIRCKNVARKTVSFTQRFHKFILAWTINCFFYIYNLFSPLMTPYIFLQATFFSFTIYNVCSPHLIQSFDFQLNFTQNMQLVTFLLIVVLLFTTKNDPFLSAFHNVWMQIKKRMIFDFTLPCSVMCSAAFETFILPPLRLFISPLVLFNINVWYIKKVFIW